MESSLRALRRLFTLTTVGLFMTTSAHGAPGDIPAPTDVSAVPADAKITASGLAYRIVRTGDGVNRPNAYDEVKCHYTGWTTDGKMFDSSVKRGTPTSFPLDRVIAGWTEGLQLMTKGGKARFWIPEKLAYQGRPGAPAGMLVFDVELIDIKGGTKPPPAPSDVAAPGADAKKTNSGIGYKILEKGDGKTFAKSADRVEVHYTGWTTDGKMFDSSVVRGQTATFGLNQVIAGWTEGMQLVSKGGKIRLWIPENLAYEGKPNRPAGMLVFDVQLIDVERAPEQPKVPADVAAAPADATRTASGLAYKVLERGGGQTHPKASNRVTVHYTGWTTDGKMFDSSVMRGQPATFGLGQVIAGWTEGVQLMKVGDKFRFWIPQDLAYKGQAGPPAGTLVFDVHLLGIQ